MRSILLLCAVTVLAGCKEKTTVRSNKPEVPEVKAKFTLLSSEATGVTFSNFSGEFKEDYTYNIFKYEYLYNGGGVAAGDVNGDSLPDLYFTATFAPNKLYINLGNFKFLDVTDKSGVAAPSGFKTGTTMADINGDGRLDIYSCRTGQSDDGLKSDHVFINMGNELVDGVNIPIFRDLGSQLGLSDNNNTNHACFFDYDRDGDLDLFQLNHRVDFTESTNPRLTHGPDGKMRRITSPSTPFESNRFYRNDKGKFTDVTKKAGLESSAFGLSLTIADLNNDGWMDLYVANDYIEPDRVLINNQDGTFTDKYFDYLRHSSLNSMGSDIADINNDGLEDIMVLDMKPEDPLRYKTLIHGMQYDRYNLLVEYGYGRQAGRNVLQMNNGNNTFSDVGQYAGMAATDWSWGSMITDFDNDGWKDVFIANGYRRDVANLDYLNYVRDSLIRTGGLNSTRFPDINDILAFIPEKKIENYLLINDQKLHFINGTKAAGMDQPSFSNGSAFADLDADGDLDIIVNNIGEPAFIYRNDISGRHWLQIDCSLEKGNIDGIGTRADLYTGDAHQTQTLITNKGFFSSSEPILHFGLGDQERIDSIILQWPDGSMEILRNIAVDHRMVWKRGLGTSYKKPHAVNEQKLFTSASTLPEWIHEEDIFVDFKREKLLPYMISREGPCLTVGDINGDKLEDIFAGNGSGFASTFFIQQPDNTFEKHSGKSLENDALYEDCGAIIEDLDQDGDNDLMVISGGNAFKLNDPGYMTRYYLNDGRGNFNRSLDFPIIRTNAGAILAFDYDSDGDQDIIIGGRSTPGTYPEAPRSYLLQNEKGRFKDVTLEVFKELDHLGMITDLESADLDGDQKSEIIFAGEWIPVSVFSYNGKIFIDKTEFFGLSHTSGWWKSINAADMDGDQDIDLIAGNIGLNHRMVTSSEQPITLITKDFDSNGSVDPILCFYFNDKLYPYAGRDAVIAQVPRLKKKFVKYTPYSVATIDDIFSAKELDGSATLKVNSFRTTCFINQGKNFKEYSLPYQVQLSPVMDALVRDFNQDGLTDILMAGNFQYSETETGEMDAGNGVLLIRQQDGSYHFVPNRDHGFWATKEVRELDLIQMADGGTAILTGNNLGPIEIHRLKTGRGPDQ